MGSDNNKEFIVIAEKLTKHFGDQIAVCDLDFEVPAGVIFGFIGPSGCGKTTTVRLLTGVYRPTRGSLKVWGKSPSQFGRSDRERIGYLPQHFLLSPDLTVWENMNFAASIYGFRYPRKDRLNELLQQVDLGAHRHKLVRNLSGGMRRRLSLAATLVHNPSLAFLDEPTAGIDPILRRDIWEYFKQLRRDGCSIFVTTQYVGEAAYCDQVGVMVAGRLVAIDTPIGLRRRAYGGDLIRFRTTVSISDEKRTELENLPVCRCPSTRIDANEIQLVVEEASTAVPKILEWARGNDINVELVEEIYPPYDDVFVRLVESENVTE